MKYLPAMNIILSVLVNYLFVFANAGEIEIDPKGYIVFCPCMGRFGNQIEQFLGALNFAHDIERTLVLPHLVEYPHGVKSAQIPFQTYFQVEPLKQYTKVILMDDFMEKIADKVWPKGKRIAFCYQFRDKKQTCEAKDGNPFGPYWDKFGIDFDQNAKFGPLGYDMDYGTHKSAWMNSFLPEKFPVLAFTGAPGAFPVLEKNVPLQKYLKWSESINNQVEQFLQRFKPNKDDKFIGIHLRNGIDFKKACEHTKSMKNSNFFASAQCLGYNTEYGQLSIELCYPSESTIMRQVGEALKKTGAKHAYIASDKDHMIKKFEKRFKKVKFVKYDSENPHMDLAILGRSDHAIVNCVSTFSAFLKRARDAENRTTDFWGFKRKSKPIDEEL